MLDENNGELKCGKQLSEANVHSMNIPIANICDSYITSLRLINIYIFLGQI